MVWSSSGVHAPFLSVGSRLLHHRSRHCLSVRPGSMLAMCAQCFPPYWLTSSISRASSFGHQGPLTFCMLLSRSACFCMRVVLTLVQPSRAAVARATTARTAAARTPAVTRTAAVARTAEVARQRAASALAPHGSHLCRPPAQHRGASSIPSSRSASEHAASLLSFVLSLSRRPSTCPSCCSRRASVALAAGVAA
eukprot:scaffold58867_cov65-Phaeocystis_antarctica.AAC.11